MTDKKKDVLQQVDGDARRPAKTLLRTARFAALGSIDQTDGSPSVSRVSISVALDGAPGFLISRLSSHFANLESDSRCSLLVGEPGKGDPLAHPRMTVIGRARRLDPGAERDALARRYIARHPKAELYAGFSDFAFWQVDVARASLNGGFGKAFALTACDLIEAHETAAVLSGIDADAVAHMNEDHKDAVAHYARLAGGEGTGWRIASLDNEGVDIVRGDQCVRLWFPVPLTSASDLRPALVELAKGR